MSQSRYKIEYVQPKPNKEKKCRFLGTSSYLSLALFAFVLLCVFAYKYFSLDSITSYFQTTETSTADILIPKIDKFPHSENIKEAMGKETVDENTSSKNTIIEKNHVLKKASPKESAASYSNIKNVEAASKQASKIVSNNSLPKNTDTPINNKDNNKENLNNSQASKEKEVKETSTTIPQETAVDTITEAIKAQANAAKANIEANPLKPKATSDVPVKNTITIVEKVSPKLPLSSGETAQLRPNKNDVAEPNSITENKKDETIGNNVTEKTRIKAQENKAATTLTTNGTKKSEKSNLSAVDAITAAMKEQAEKKAKHETKNNVVNVVKINPAVEGKKERASEKHSVDKSKKITQENKSTTRPTLTPTKSSKKESEKSGASAIDAIIEAMNADKAATE